MKTHLSKKASSCYGLLQTEISIPYPLSLILHKKAIIGKNNNIKSWKKVWIRHKRKFSWESKRNQVWDPETTTKIHSQPKAIGSKYYSKPKHMWCYYFSHLLHSFTNQM